MSTCQVTIYVKQVRAWIIEKTLRILSFLRFLEVRPYFQGPLLLWVTCGNLGPSYTFSYLGFDGLYSASQITPQITNVTWHGCLGFYWRVQKTCCTINGEEYHHSHLNEGFSLFFENFPYCWLDSSSPGIYNPPGNLLLKTTNVTCLVGFPSMLCKTTWIHCHWTLCPSELRERHRPFLPQTMLAGIQPYKQQNWSTAMALVPMSLK